MMLVFVIGIDRTEIYGGCVAVSALIHYFTLAGSDVDGGRQPFSCSRNWSLSSLKSQPNTSLQCPLSVGVSAGTLR